ncbi:MAG: metallopeptidase TldD-related protein, partial [Candidatus Saganbacteria bacterium]|nr:metallopeptidase TldD-related protein [Candidatus Saganbacteria bacterium]
PGPSPYTEMNIFDPQIASVPVETKIELTKAIEKAAYNLDPRIKKTENTGYCESESEVHIRNTKGIDCSYTSNYCGGFAQVISSSGEGEEEGYYYNFKKKWKGLDPVQTGEKAAAKAMALLDGRTIKSGKLPVVLDNETAAEMLEVISGMISADATQKGKSLFAGKTGKQIASATVSITDDGTLADRTGTSPFDDEGVPKRRNIIVEDGVLNSFLYNVYTASKDKTKSTGNGKRASFKYPPVIGPNNMFVEPGTSSREKIISKITKGILIMRLMALHTINPVSGDFSLGAAGLMIENGKTTYPVRGITISGNLIELLRSVEEIGNDLEFFAQADNCGSPSLLIGSLDVSGN